MVRFCRSELKPVVESGRGEHYDAEVAQGARDWLQRLRPLRVMPLEAPVSQILVLPAKADTACGSLEVAGRPLSSASLVTAAKELGIAKSSSSELTGGGVDVPSSVARLLTRPCQCTVECSRRVQQ